MINAGRDLQNMSLPLVIHRTLRWAVRCLAVGLLAGIPPSMWAIESCSTINTSDPGTPPWNYVGAIGDASGVYLGDYDGINWVLTASHVGPGNFVLNGITYDAINGSGITLTNPNGSLTDLTLFRIRGAPGLANLAIESQDQPIGTAVQMIGFGGGSRSWATNTIYGYTQYSLGGTPYLGEGILTLASRGAQGMGGDSGGGTFVQTADGTWELAGILSGVGEIRTLMGTDLGQGTVAADVATYSNQINATIASTAIPEPADYAALLGLFALSITSIARVARPPRPLAKRNPQHARAT